MNRQHVFIIAALALAQGPGQAQTFQVIQQTPAAQRTRYAAPTQEAPLSVEFIATAATGADMNDAGDVIGTSYLDVGCGSFCLPPLETVVWRGGQRIVLPSLPGFTGIAVRGINNQGWMVGVAGYPYTSPRAVAWKPAGNSYQVIDLGTLPGKTTSEAIGIDEQGRVIGWSSTTNFPPSGAPFSWTEGGGMVDLSAQGFPAEMPLAISPGGTVATTYTWYRLDDPGSVAVMPTPPSGYGILAGSAAINDAGDQGRFLVRVSGQNLVYLYRYHHEGLWQQLSPSGTGHLTTYGMGSINAARDVTATIQSTGVIALGPDGSAKDLASRLTPAYPDRVVTMGGPINAAGEILAQVMIGRSTRLARLTPTLGCTASQGLVQLGEQCLRVADLMVSADFIPDPNDPSQSQCAPTLNAHNEVLVTVTVTDGMGFPLEGALVLARFLDDYWTDDSVLGATGPDGQAIFSYTGLCGVGAVAFLVDDVHLTGFVLDRNAGVLSGWAIPQ